MNHLNMKTRFVVAPLYVVVVVALVLLLAATTQATTPGITAAAPATGTSTSTFNLTAAAGSITQPDGTLIYSWGYGCAGGAVTYAPAAFQSLGFCPTMQVPGPTLIVHKNDTVTVTLTNNLPAGAGNTSIVFPGFQVSANGTGVTGLLAQEAIPGGSVTYTFTATTPGTRAYYSGTQSDFQIEMGLYGAIVVLPTATPSGGTNCHSLNADVAQTTVGTGNPGADLRLAASAYDHPETCYDREYLFQFMELDSRIHRQAEEQTLAIARCTTATNSGNPCPTSLSVE